MNLTLLIIIPVITAIAILICTGSISRLVALTGAVIQLMLSVFLASQYLVFRNDAGVFAFQSRYTWFETLHIDLLTGVDGISVSMILLTSVVVLAGVLVSWNVFKMKKEFFFLLMLLSAGAYGFFISLDLFSMFFFLEVAVIPKYLLIGIWGSGKKEYAANKLALMLMGGSALVLVGILGLYFSSGSVPSFDINFLKTVSIPFHTQKILFPLLFLGFGIFTAIFPFHTWVPDGHSSAPTAASMFLAGISMKLGGYGCIRVAINLMPEAANYYSHTIVLLAAIAIIYGAFATMMQTDLKYMNAYSSISHCGFVLLGIGMMTETSVHGAVLQMISHGLMTALFFAVIGMIYQRAHTRDIAQLGGLMKVMPFISAVFFIAGFCSLGLPGLSGFVAEMTIFIGSWQRTEEFYRIATIVGCMSIVVTAVYILRAAGSSLMGPLMNPEFKNLHDAEWNEKLSSSILVICILIMGILPFTVNDLVQPSTKLLMQSIVQTLSSH